MIPARESVSFPVVSPSHCLQREEGEVIRRMDWKGLFLSVWTRKGVAAIRALSSRSEHILQGWQKASGKDGGYRSGGGFSDRKRPSPLDRLEEAATGTLAIGAARGSALSHSWTAACAAQTAPRAT